MRTGVLRARRGSEAWVPWPVWAFIALVAWGFVGAGVGLQRAWMPWVIPVAGLALVATRLGLRGWWWRRQRKALANVGRSLAGMRSLDWREFEMAVGEAYRRGGYRVMEAGLGGADGGVDLVLTRNGRKTVVQCKHWKANRIGVAVVRELAGVMVHVHADFGKVVCSNGFTREAWAYVRGKPIELVDGNRLVALLGNGAGDGVRSLATEGLESGGSR